MVLCSVMELFLCFSRLSLFVLLANAEIAAGGEGFLLDLGLSLHLGLMFDLGRTLRLTLDPLRSQQRGACRSAHSTAVFLLTVRARVALRAPVFQPAVGAGAARRAVVFQPAVRAELARHAVVFPLAVRAGVARPAAAFHLAVRTPLLSHRSCATTLHAHASAHTGNDKVGVVASFVPIFSVDSHENCTPTSDTSSDAAICPPHVRFNTLPPPFVMRASPSIGGAP